MLTQSPTVRMEEYRTVLKRLMGSLGVEPGFLRLRRRGFAQLSGFGLEIGAFEHPARLPRRCSVRYADVLTLEEARRRFPEVDVSRMVQPHVIIDVDAGGMGAIRPASLDFVIACHVIEHVANPGRFVEDLVRVVRPGGHVAIAAPDKQFTFDRRRRETPLSELESYYRVGRPAPTPQDYRDMLTAVHPEILEQGQERMAAALQSFLDRREHLSVWTAHAFRTFLTSAYQWCGADMTPDYEVSSDKNHFEYFGVWRRLR